MKHPWNVQVYDEIVTVPWKQLHLSWSSDCDDATSGF